MGLKEYNQKRDFEKTSEPKGKEDKSSDKLAFVVQRHAATRLHYDFRLEMEGVLKSWAVPKGPSLNPKDKRLAIMVEDHPYSYRTFEGTIPAESYGGGEVEIWDEGTYEALEKEENKSDEDALLDGLKKGSLKVILYGKKLKGEFALVKLKSEDSENAWLLIKHKDEFAVSDSYDAESYTREDSKVTAHAEKRYKNFKKKTLVVKEIMLPIFPVRRSCIIIYNPCWQVCVKNPLMTMIGCSKLNGTDTEQLPI